MSCKKYILKKDLKAYVLKSKEKLPSTPISPSVRAKLSFLKNSPVTFLPIIKKPTKIAKSLQTLKGLNKRRFKSSGRKTLERSLPNGYYHIALSKNLRYLKANPEEFDDKNLLVTPSDSINSKKDSLRGKIESEYQEYINRTDNYVKQLEAPRSVTPDTYKSLNQGRDNILAQTPPDFTCFWKRKRIF
jgi:hypothetical protein